MLTTSSIAVSSTGRKFSTFPAGLDANNTNTGSNGKYQVAELINGTEVSSITATRHKSSRVPRGCRRGSAQTYDLVQYQPGLNRTDIHRCLILRSCTTHLQEALLTGPPHHK